MQDVDPRYFRSALPEGRSGKWELSRFTVRELDGYDPRTDPRPDFAKRRPGTYTQLERGTTVFMTDLYDEWWTQRVAIEEACRRGGHVLITGLGLGMVVESMLRAPGSRVERVTVVERSPDVIRLVAPHLERLFGDRLRVVRADAFAWETDDRFTVAWHDVWPSPYGDEVRAQMARLEERFRDRCAWQGCWPREYLAVYGMAGRSTPSPRRV